MDINAFLDSVCNEIKYKPIRNEIAEELKGHINEIKQEYIDKGLESNQAENKAIEQMGNPKEIGFKLNKIHKPRLDWKLLMIMISVLGFSFLVTFTRAQNHIIQEVEIAVLTKYIISIIIGIIFSVICYFADYRRLLNHSNKIFIIASLSIIASITFGAAFGEISHIKIGRYMFSPSIIAMPLYIIAFVGFLENINKDNKIKVKFLEEKNINVIKIIISSIFSLYLLILIPSITTALIVCLSYLILATIKMYQMNKNIKRNISLLWGVSTILILIGVIITVNSPLGLLRFNRITTSFNPENDPNGAGWIGINQNLIINSAQLIGEAENMSNALNIFDEGTNYALISLLAHYGWIVSGTMILIVLLLSIKLIINAIKIKEIYGKNIIIGISIMFILQSICNILMNFNFGIQADFNIPFISYGCVNLIANMICISIIFSVYRRKYIRLKDKEMKTSMN